MRKISLSNSFVNGLLLRSEMRSRVAAACADISDTVAKTHRTIEESRELISEMDMILERWCYAARS